MTLSTPSTLTELIARAGGADAHTKLEFVSSDSMRTVTVGELHARARRVAGGLRKLGVEPGSRVSVQLTNRLESVVVQFAVLMADAVLVPIVPVFGAREVTQVFQDARPSVHITQRRWNKFDYLSVAEAVPEEARPPRIVMLDDTPEGYVSWARLEQAEPLADEPTHDENACCLVIYTSGSTGVPKGVQHSRRSLLAEACDYDYRAHNDSAVDVYLQGSAAGHIGGDMFPLRAVLYHMRTLVMDGWNAELACRLVESEKVTAMVATPFHAVGMLELAEAGKYDLSSIRMMMCGGAPVSPSLVRRADASGVGLVRAYGMSEHPTVALGRWQDPLDVRADHDGYLTGGNRVRLVDENGAEVPRGALGEIQLQGPEQFMGYTNVPDDQVFTGDGWFPTGDIGVLDERGLLTVVDRKKNIIIRGGENLSAAEIEGVVATHPSVAEVAVVGIPDERYGERACAFVVLKPDATLDLEQLAAHFLASGVAKQKIPERLEFIEALPRTGTGKIRKHELTRMRTQA
ncbi:class I adenylate-forming enzyme family protein [Streptomyces mexicanus]|uniref:class I adenylate-forming enzyme family protein n=1 Tax=Streptomyces mexicanus TaxID=178566 RepID=UPI00135C1F59|nr:AMP-binding protein [Streptomyces mexicanus]